MEPQRIVLALLRLPSPQVAFHDSQPWLASRSLIVHLLPPPPRVLDVAGVPAEQLVSRARLRLLRPPDLPPAGLDVHPAVVRDRGSLAGEQVFCAQQEYFLFEVEQVQPLVTLDI